MCRNTVFCGPVHIKGTNLNLKRLTGRSNQRCVQRLIHIGFRHGNVVLKPSRNRCIHFMNHTQCRITVPDGFHLNPYRKYIVYLVQRLMLVHHFLVNAEKVLYSAVNLCLDSRIINMMLHILYNFIDKGFPFRNPLINLSC